MRLVIHIWAAGRKKPVYPQRPAGKASIPSVAAQSPLALRIASILPAAIVILNVASALVWAATPPAAAEALPRTHSVFSVKPDNTGTLLNGQPFLVAGLRVSNALVSDQRTQELLDHLDDFRSYGVNTFSVFLQGSRFGDVRGYREDGTLDSVYADRLGRIIQAADARGMVVLVGCLYHGDSQGWWRSWRQADAERAVANTITWLKERNYRNVFVDVNNEQMAKFDDAGLIAAGKAIDPAYVIATSGKLTPANADLSLHHGSPQIPGKYYIETEGTGSDYWGSYSKRPGLYDYINIGVYTDAMKRNMLQRTDSYLDRGHGYLFASTWLQNPPPAGPNHRPGGSGTREDPGVRWWLEHLRARLGSYQFVGPPDPPVSASAQGDSPVVFRCDFEADSWFEEWGLSRAPERAQLVTADPERSYEPLRGRALRVHVERGGHYGLSLTYPFKKRLGYEPEEIYFRYYLRLADDWTPRQGGKLPGFGGTYGRAGWGGRPVDGTDGWSARGLFQGHKDGRTPIGFYCYHMDMRGRYGSNWVWDHQQRGFLENNRWYCVEQFVRLNAPGAADGILRGWIDGELAFEKTDIRFRSVDALKIEAVWVNVYLGGTWTAERDHHLYLDDVVIATAPIGP